MSLRQLDIGEQVIVNGRGFEVVGFTSMSVTPKRVFLRDLETEERLTVLADELRATDAASLR